ncbi:hypothetical protein DAETH_30550 [Deinococcus aetherius]|uniref:Roadblock/LAMTOR2 domain-containing protein n=1 Tax=Deinococcus aetherius TaxID=200252 RepID=A0ABM8AH77_9DEIO|nr:hypothetical protein [Deinococcus aetherius]BDP43086.1 hypothetical protein DAETH_30550 [Deinococcus aetherius]
MTGGLLEGNATPPPADVLVVSASVGRGKGAERLVESLGLRARRAVSLAGLRAALRARPAAAVLLELPLAGFGGPGDLLLPAGTRLLAFGAEVPAGVASLGPVLTPETLRPALAFLLPGPAAPPPPSPGNRRLMRDLLGKPGVLGVTLLTAGRQPLGAEGEALPAPLLPPLCALLDAARALGELPQGGPLFSAQLEFEHRTLLIVEHGELLIVCVLRDPSLASLVRYLLRSRPAA